MLEKVIDLRCPRISLETGCTIQCVLGFAKFRGVTCLFFFAYTISIYFWDFRSPSPPIENPWRRPWPGIYYKQKKAGGIHFNSTCALTKVDEKLVQLILHEYKIFNAEVIFREDATADQLIDTISDNRVHLPCLYVYNKIDQISIEEVDRLARQPNSVVVSCNMKLNLDYLLFTMWEMLALIRIYTKKPGKHPDFGDAIIMRRGSTVEHVCHSIHRSIVAVFKYALVWGRSTKYSPQRVGLAHVVEDEDVIQVVKK